jgi:hypothetical protein
MEGSAITLKSKSRRALAVQYCHGIAKGILEISIYIRATSKWTTWKYSNFYRNKVYDI